MMMLRLSSMLVLVFVITIPLSILITRFITTRTNPLFRLRSRKMGELNDFVEEKISGMKTLKAYHQEGSVTGQLDALNSEVVQAYYKSEYYSSITGPSVSFVNNLSLSLISVFGGLLYMSGGVQIGGLAIAGMTIGGISSFIMYSRKFAGPINEIANIFCELAIRPGRGGSRVLPAGRAAGKRGRAGRGNACRCARRCGNEGRELWLRAGAADP